MSVYLYLCVAQRTGSSGTIKENVLPLQELETETKSSLWKNTPNCHYRPSIESELQERKVISIIDKLIPQNNL